MRLKLQHSKTGSAFVQVLISSSLGMVMLGSTLSYMSGGTRLLMRNSQSNTAGYAPEAAVQMVLAGISQEFQTNGETSVYNKLSTYRSLVPASTKNSLLDYQFSDGQGNLNKTYVSRTATWSFGELKSKYTGLHGYAATYRIVSNARSLSPYRNTNLVSAVREDVQLASIPIFQYQAYYATNDLEICPGGDFALKGRVHANGNCYFQPADDLTFGSDVTSAKSIVHKKSPYDPVVRTNSVSISYSEEHDDGIKSLNIPLGTNSLRTIIERPPAGETTNSIVGLQRLYNKAALIILISNNTVTATSGRYNNSATTIAWATVSAFLKTNVVFYDKRESKYIRTTQFDIAAFQTKYTTLTSQLGRAPLTVYLADERTAMATTNSAIRVINGQTIPSGGLTIATRNPLYIEGHYNTAFPGTTNTTQSAPAAFAADSVTILSEAWADNQASSDLSSRKAKNTTINAAFITGIVPSGNGYYSGGFENVLRLLEKWDGFTFTFNGAVSVLYSSKIATAPWGAGSDVYTAPTRAWSWDTNFKTSTKLPPATPEIRTIINDSLASIAPNKIQ